MIGLVAIVLGVIVGLTIWVVHAPLILLLPLVAIGAAVTDYSNGGRSGFYEVAADGSLGEFLGRAKPNLDSMRGMRVR